jgi:hypothetical protein
MHISALKAVTDDICLSSHIHQWFYLNAMLDPVSINRNNLLR